MKKLFKEHDLLKTILILLVVIVLMTWFIPYGEFGSSAVFSEGEVTPIGIAHLVYGLIYSMNNYAVQIAFILLIGMFYGVAVKTEGYKALVAKISKAFKGKEIPFALAVSFVITVLASILNNTYILLFFMPFIISVLRRIGLDKISSFAITFGSILVGILGATYGTEGFVGFLEWVINGGGTDLTMSTMIVVRAGVLLLAYILFSFFNLIYIKKLLAKKDEKGKNEVKVIDDAFAVEEPKKKNTKTWLTGLVLIVLFIFAILGFITWNATASGTEVFGIEIFDDFHEWLMSLTIGSNEVAIFERILGGPFAYYDYQLVPAFGNWYLFTYAIVIIIAMIIMAIVSKMKFSEFFENMGSGALKVIKPIAYLVLAYTAFIFLYWVTLTPTLINEIGSLANGFNPFILTIQAIVSSIINSDFAYIGYSLSTYLGSFTGAELNLGVVIFSTIYGLIQFVTPISMFLVFGLTYMNIPYKKWLKYIWKFFVGMLVCLLVIFTLLAYL